MERQALRIPVITQGIVQPRTQSVLASQVQGSITWVSPSFVSGGYFKEGEIILRIDPRD